MIIYNYQYWLKDRTIKNCNEFIKFKNLFKIIRETVYENKNIDKLKKEK